MYGVQHYLWHGQILTRAIPAPLASGGMNMFKYSSSHELISVITETLLAEIGAEHRIGVLDLLQEIGWYINPQIVNEAVPIS